MLSKTNIRFFSLLLTVIFLATTTDAQDADLAALRDDMARRYFEPETHMRLAKYIHEKGNRLVAFFILESARNTRFEKDEFDNSFARHFRGKPDNSETAEAKLLTDISKNPESVVLLKQLSDIYFSRERFATAQLYIERILKVEPDNEAAIVALSEVFRRSGDDEKSKKIIDDYASKHSDSLMVIQKNIYESIEKDNFSAAKPLLLDAIKKYPEDSKLCMAYAAMSQHENNLLDAEKYYVKASSLEKDNAKMHAFVGSFFDKVLKKTEKALSYYLSAYFIDPHAYDGEYAESRIRSMALELAEKDVARKLNNRIPLESIAKNENPVIAGVALSKMEEDWDKKYISTLVNLMGHDDPTIRAEATDLLKNKTGKEFDEQLKNLLKDSDLRKRDLAAYIAVNHWKKDSHELMQKWLNEDVQLIRFDAISALMIDGGEEGKKVVKSYRNKETNPWLKKLLQEELK